MGRRAVFFDFGGTLCRSKSDLRVVFQRAAERAGVALPIEEYLRANDACWAELWPEATGLVGQLPSFADRVHETAAHRVGLGTASAALTRSIRELATSVEEHEPFPETEGTLTALRAQGVPLHIVSEHVDYLPIIIARLGWSRLFETVTFTQEVGFHKPDPRVFEFALRRAGRTAQESVFVGDSWEADYLGASGVGMEAVWLNRGGAKAPSACRQISTLGEIVSMTA